MERCSVALKCVAGSQFAMMRREEGGRVRRGVRRWGRVVSLLWCGDGSSPKGNHHLITNPQLHKRSWKGSVISLLERVGAWCGVVCAVVCCVVDCLLLCGGSSSLCCWCQLSSMHWQLCRVQTRHVTSVTLHKKKPVIVHKIFFSIKV